MDILEKLQPLWPIVLMIIVLILIIIFPGEKNNRKGDN